MTDRIIGEADIELVVRDYHLQVAFRVNNAGSYEWDTDMLDQIVSDCADDFARETERVAVVNYNIDAVVRATTSSVSES